VLPLFYKVLYIVSKFLQRVIFAHVLRSNNGALKKILEMKTTYKDNKKHNKFKEAAPPQPKTSNTSMERMQ
jgi:hypothetical protein